MAYTPCCQKGRCAIVTERGAGCDGRCGVRCVKACRTRRLQRTAKSCGPGAATVASILREDIPQTTVTKNAAHRGEHEVSRKAIAWGKPGCLGCTCSPCPCASHMGCPCAPAHGIYGRSQRPAFPAPSLRRGTNEMNNSGEFASRDYPRLSSPSLAGRSSIPET